MRRKKRSHIFTVEAGIAVFVAFGLDLLGEPPTRWHPVVWYGKLIQFLQRAAPQKPVFQFLYGIVMLALALSLAWLPAATVQMIARHARTAAMRHGNRMGGFLLFALLEGMALKPFFALRMLVEAGRQVRLHLEQGDLPAARQALQALVSRDRSQLTAELVSAAVVESLAENLSDSVVAPLFYYLLCGLPGAAIYRLVNTCDAMIGYHGQYEYLGKAAARCDDLLNLLPARFTALLITTSAPLWHGKVRAAWHIWRRDAYKTTSPNAGHPMAAAAGALGLQLEKAGHYILGDYERPIAPYDIRRAEQMVWWLGCGVIALTGLIKVFWSGEDEASTL